MAILENFDKAFESRVRLGIMSILMVNEWVSFVEFKDLLVLSDGNLASHLNALEKLAYIEVKKSFIGKKPNTAYCTTELGKQAFKKHLKALENLIQ